MMNKNPSGRAKFLAPYVMQDPDRLESTGELERSLCATDLRVARQFARVTFLSDNRGDLPHVAVSSPILQCSGDMAPPQSGALTLEQA